MVFTNKVVVVTGASRGIGKEIAQVFAEQGAKVVLVAQQEAPLEELEDTLLAAGYDVTGMAGDITDEVTVQALLQEVAASYGHVDVLINNAAVATLKPLVQMSMEEAHRMLQVNFMAMVHLSQLFLPGMIEQRSGVIINMSAAVGRSGYPNLAVYSATKAAIIAFSEAVAKEVRRYGVQVYSILPHGVDTSLYHTLFGASDADKLLSPARVAQDVLRVASGDSGLRSGQTLEIQLS
jgi:short-subunit dehydrogenase